MSDQADILRHLVAGALRGHGFAHAPPPPMIAVAGAKGGVGTTTVAVNLAVSLAGAGQRVLVVDVDLTRADVAAICGVNPRYTTADVLAGRREIHEVLISGPGGIQLAPGAWASPEAVECRPAAQRRLIAQLAQLGEHLDLILLDVGNDTNDTMQQYWHAAARVLLVSTADSIAMMDAYAAIKIAMSPREQPPVDLIVNKLADDQSALDVHHRIDLSCQRFLGFCVGLAGEIPLDEEIVVASRKRELACLKSPQCAAAQCIEQIAGHIAAMPAALANA